MTQQNSSLNGSRTREAYDQMIGRLRTEGALFMKAAAHNIAPEQATEVADIANAWLETKQATQSLNAWIEDITSFLDNEMPENGPIGHDKRHLAKDIAAGTHRLVDDGVKGFDTLSLIPSFLHDTGRLVEARYEGVIPFSETSGDHAYFSFGIASQFACKPYFKIIPKQISDQILYAILGHSGSKVITPMAHAVQSADREQLIGPEGIARLLAVQVGVQNFSLLHSNQMTRPYQPKDAVEPIYDGLHSVEFYMRYLYPQHGRLGETRADGLKTISVAFLLMATPTKLQKQIFGPELGVEPVGSDILAPNSVKSKKAISSSVWARARIEAEAYRPVATDAEKGVAFVFNASGASSNAVALNRFTTRFDELPPSSQNDLTRAFSYADFKRKKLDRKDLKLLAQEQTRPDFRGKIAGWAHKVLSAAST